MMSFKSEQQQIAILSDVSDWQNQLVVGDKVAGPLHHYTYLQVKILVMFKVSTKSRKIFNNQVIAIFIANIKL